MIWEPATNRVVRLVQHKVRLRFLGLPETSFTFMLDTGSDRTYVPLSGSELLSLGAAHDVIAHDSRTTILYIKRGQPVREKFASYELVYRVEISLGLIRPFPLEVGAIEDHGVRTGILGRDAIEHFAVLLDPGGARPATYVGTHTE